MYLLFCDFTQSHCNELLMRVSAWMTKGNWPCENESGCWNMPRRDILFRITKHEHILQPTLSMSHSQGGGGGCKLAYLSVRVGRKDYTHKKGIYPKNHWVISVPQNTSLVYHTFMWIKLTVWVIIELNKSECAIDKIRVVQQCQHPKWISCR